MGCSLLPNLNVDWNLKPKGASRSNFHCNGFVIHIFLYLGLIFTPHELRIQAECAHTQLRMAYLQHERTILPPLLRVTTTAYLNHHL
jgi:hypothetical protein